MRAIGSLAGSLLAVGLAACASGGGSAASASATPSANAEATRNVLVTSLIPNNNSGNRITGRIRLVPSTRADEMMAEIDIRGGAYQTKLGWEIRSGQCGDNGQALGTVMAYPIIETRGDGMAQVKRPVRVSIPESGVYHVAIFPSATARNTVVSCGVLSRES